MRFSLLFLFVFSFFACAPRANFVKTELYFGLNIPAGGQVSALDFQQFIDTAVSPRFPQGLTLLAADGQWQDTSSQKIDKEPSKILLLLYPRTQRRQAHQKIDQIRRSYQKKFDQQAVMRVDYRVRTSF
jgi:hypothetical protein